MALNFDLTEANKYQEILEEKVIDLQKRLHLTERERFEINLILDEISSNIFANNNNVNDLKINIELRWEDDEITMFLKDNGSPFDPTSVPLPDTTLPLSEREAGGLGVFLVKQYSRTLRYSRVGNLNQSTIKKQLTHK